MIRSIPLVSVVIATFNRPQSVATLLQDLAAQSLPSEQFEVLVVDDGSSEPVDALIDARGFPYHLTITRQTNAGPAAARDRAIRQAVGELIVIVDDDMRIAPHFLVSHVAAHPAGSRRVALGVVRSDASTTLSLFERFHTDGIERLATEAREPGTVLHGSRLYTGNVSFRRADYLAVGGFDPQFRISEDAELGLRLEAAGVAFVSCPDAETRNVSGHASLEAWMRRSVEYGATDTRISAKHPEIAAADPWRFLFQVRAVSRPFLLAAARRPWFARPLARAVMAIAFFLDRRGFERPALAATTFAYGLLYFAGVGEQCGTRAAVSAGLGRCLNRMRYAELGPRMKLRKLGADIRADHAALARADERYASSERRPRLVSDAIQRIGFQMMVAYRVMRWLRGSGRSLLARIASRAIRHTYGADIHWDAELAPGVVIVHGLGLIISHAARVERDVILFQHVTLGESIHPDTRRIGAPTIERGVHVGAGATLLGPIVVGRGSKIMAGTVLTRSVPADSLVESAAPTVRPRRAGSGVSDERAGAPIALHETKAAASRRGAVL